MWIGKIYSCPENNSNVSFLMILLMEYIKFLLLKFGILWNESFEVLHFYITWIIISGGYQYYYKLQVMVNIIKVWFTIMLQYLSFAWLSVL